MDPGWYPDPFSPNLLRWWDGQTWTAQTAPMHSTLPSGWAPVDPRPDIARANVAARRAAIAVVFGAVVYIAQYFITALVIGDAFHKLIPRYATTSELPTTARRCTRTSGCRSTGSCIWSGCRHSWFRSS